MNKEEWAKFYESCATQWALVPNGAGVALKFLERAQEVRQDIRRMAETAHGGHGCLTPSSYGAPCRSFSPFVYGVAAVTKKAWIIVSFLTFPTLTAAHPELTGERQSD